MKPTILILLIFFSCNTKKSSLVKEMVRGETEYYNTPYGEFADTTVYNSISTDTREWMSDIDSNLYYMGIHMDLKIEELENEVMYHKTRDEKYRKAFYATQEKRIEAAKRGTFFQEKLKARAN